MQVPRRVARKQIDKARESIAQLKKLCPGGCEELADLEKTIAAASKTN